MLQRGDKSQHCPYWHRWNLWERSGWDYLFWIVVTSANIWENVLNMLVSGAGMNSAVQASIYALWISRALFLANMSHSICIGPVRMLNLFYIQITRHNIQYNLLHCLNDDSQPELICVSSLVYCRLQFIRILSFLLTPHGKQPCWLLINDRAIALPARYTFVPT